MIKFKLTGQWNKAMNIFSQLSKIFKKVRRNHMEKLGKQGLDIVHGHFDSQDLNWEPLGDPYKQLKAKQGLVTDILMASKRYRESITYEATPDSVWIGVPVGERTISGEDMSMIAAVHEYGSRGNNIPERPLWQPSFDELMKWWEQEGFPAFDIIDELKSL